MYDVCMMIGGNSIKDKKFVYIHKKCFPCNIYIYIFAKMVPEKGTK